MKIVVEHDRSSVHYNETSDTFIKRFNPKIESKIKYFLRLRKYPGQNFFYISNLLNSLNIKTAKIVAHSNYHVETENVNGIILEDFIKTNENCQHIVDKYISLILTLLKHDIYSGDLHLRNFIVKNNEIYALDLEDYRHVKAFSRGKDEFFRRLKGKIPKHIFKEIEKRHSSNYN